MPLAKYAPGCKKKDITPHKFLSLLRADAIAMTPIKKKEKP